MSAAQDRRLPAESVSMILLPASGFRQKEESSGLSPQEAIFQGWLCPSAFSRKAVVSYWPKYVHKVLVNRLGGLSLPRKSVVRLTDRPDMTLDVYRGRKTTLQQQYNKVVSLGRMQ